MLTSYMVKCPYPGCDWFGSLLPRNDVDSWHGALPQASVVVFQCPECGEEWKARVVGDDVKPLPLEEPAIPWA